MTNTTTITSLRIDSKDLEQLKKIGKVEDLTISQILRKLIKDYLKNR